MAYKILALPNIFQMSTNAAVQHHRNVTMAKAASTQEKVSSVSVMTITTDRNASTVSKVI